MSAKRATSVYESQVRVSLGLAAVLSVLLGLMLMLPFTGGYFSGAAAALGGLTLLALCCFVVLISQPYHFREALPHTFRTVCSWPSILLLGFFAVKMVHDGLAWQASTGLRGSGNHILWSMVYVGCGFLILSYPVQVCRWRVAFMAAALAFYSIGNVIGYQLGMAPHIATYGTVKAIDGSSIMERIIVPFGPGLNNFGCFLALGIQVNLIAAWLAWRARDGLLMLIAIIGVLSCSYVIFLAQIRSGLIGLFFAVGFVAAPLHLKRWIALGAGLGMLLLPVAFFRLAAVNWLPAIVPHSLEERIERNANEFVVLGGRAYIYDYGLDLLLKGEVGLTGMGMVKRDSSPVAAEFAADVEGATLSFHNGALEILIVYGPLIGCCLLGVILAPLFLRVPNGWRSEQDSYVAMQGVLGSLCVTSYLEAFTSMWIFWMVAIVAIVSLVQLKKLPGNSQHSADGATT